MALEEKIQLRLAFFAVVALVVFSVLLGRLWYLQVLARGKYASLAESNRIRVVKIDAPRGIIYDRNGNLLVSNKPALAVTVLPYVLKEKTGVLNSLASLLGMSPVEITKKIEGKDVDSYAPQIIKKDVGKDVVTYLEEHRDDFPGVDVKVITIRDYPNGELAAHVLGYLGEVSGQELKRREFEENAMGDIVGKTGVERSYDELLQGVKGEEQVEVNAVGRRLRVLSNKDAVAGHNLVLTIDKNVQAVTESVLKEALTQAQRAGYKNAKAGAAVVMDSKTGEIIAMASLPTYEPSLFIGGISPEEWQKLNAKESNYPLNNRALMSYPPGSTFKPFTAVSALVSGGISTNSTFVCGGIWTEMGKRWAKYCWKRSGHGGVSLYRGIVESCDIYFYEAGYKLYKLFKSTGKEVFQEWTEKFGFGSSTGIGLISEASGRVPTQGWKKEWNRNNPDPASRKWLPGDSVNMAIGQGDLLVTPLQLANAYATIANEGTLFEPRLAKECLTADGDVLESYKPKVIRRIGFSPQILGVLRQALEGVTSRGTAQGTFAGFPVKVAGKTGTAQVRGKDDFAWFACYAPTDDPKYVVVVLVEQGGHGGTISAPAARQILSYLFGLPLTGYLNVVDVSR